METDLRIGSTVWIDHQDSGDVYYKVKLILERQPSSVEICRLCSRGQLKLAGHLIQTGILDDKIYAVCHCTKCCGITVFIYHVESHLHELPEVGSCDEQTL